MLAEKQDFKPLYELELPVEEKIRTVVQKIYGGDDVVFSDSAKKQLKTINANGWGDYPVCMAKTQYSFTDDPKKLGRPTGFEITIRELIPKTGAGFIVALTGDIMTMPGLPKQPAALNMDIDDNGHAVGLF